MQTPPGAARRKHLLSASVARSWCPQKPTAQAVAHDQRGETADDRDRPRGRRGARCCHCAGRAHRRPLSPRFRAGPDRDTTRAGGVLSRSGTPIASWFMNEADLIIAGVVVRQHTGIERSKAHHPGRLRAHATRPLPPGHAAGLGRDRGLLRCRRAARRAACAGPIKSPSLLRWAIWRGKGPRLRRRPQPRACIPRPCSKP